MLSDRNYAPTPDLRIILAEALHAHEEHDSQRSSPLIERLRREEYVINPPLVAPLDATRYVILDGANRCFALKELGYPHILVQVAAYDSGYVELETWNHIISGWSTHELLDALRQLPAIDIREGQDVAAIAHLLTDDQRVLALGTAVETAQERMSALRAVVRIYQENAHLHRTTISEPEALWPLYPDANALVIFARVTPADILTAARYGALLPPGVSRHIVHGRALRVNYPLALLRDPNKRLSDKNHDLKIWLQDRLANRQVRYYAEATYQFDE